MNRKTANDKKFLLPFTSIAVCFSLIKVGGRADNLKRREGSPKDRPSEASLSFFLESWLILKSKSRISREKFLGLKFTAAFA